MSNLSFDVTFAFLANYPEFPDSCIFFKLSFLEDCFKMFVNCTNILIKQLCHLSLSQPNRIILKLYFK